jgi:hypothetical protein
MEFVHINDKDELEISVNLTKLISDNDDDDKKEEEGQNLEYQLRRL